MTLLHDTFTHDLVVIGAGPAGMRAALTAEEQGLRVLLLDEQPRPGGQIYRHITAVSSERAARLGADYQYGALLTTSLTHSKVEVRYGASVWAVDKGLTVTVQQGGRTFQVRAPQLIAATGAMERPSPLPGWTLPGVLNAGAAQILLKSAASVPKGPTVLVGGGPLLLLVAGQLVDAGAQVAAVVETSPSANRWQALRHLGGALLAPAYLLKGLRMLGRLKAAGIPHFTEATNVRVEGEDRAREITFQAGKRYHRVAVDTVLLHNGVVPNTQLTRLLRVDHHWDDAQLAWHPTVDQSYQTSLPGLRVAGDGAAIAGALAAEASGALAALAAMRAMGRLSATQEATLAEPWHAKGVRQARIRPFLDALYRPAQWLLTPADDTVVCRCEEVTAGRVREMARLGCQGPNQTKFFSRCGMGPCQGRQCGITVSQLLAQSLGKTVQEVGSYRIRAPLKPVPLESLAALSDASSQPDEGEPA
ncbi:MAG: NAD(P)/FAD-dependent oxidoreductase [Burkholderiaceae bacterium]|nr:NAD(P)/FAD-dependent oxidoreductase [Burkholderiaceae bacterium]